MLMWLRGEKWTNYMFILISSQTEVKDITVTIPDTSYPSGTEEIRVHSHIMRRLPTRISHYLKFQCSNG